MKESISYFDIFKFANQRALTSKLLSQWFSVHPKTVQSWKKNKLNHTLKEAHAKRFNELLRHYSELELEFENISINKSKNISIDKNKYIKNQISTKLKIEDDLINESIVESELFDCNTKSEIDDYLKNTNIDYSYVDKNGNNLIQISIIKRNSLLAIYFIKNGVDINNCNNNQNTAIHLACILGEQNLVRIISKLKHVNLELKNTDGETPLLLSIKYNHINPTKYLLNAGANTDYLTGYLMGDLLIHERTAMFGVIISRLPKSEYIDFNDILFEILSKADEVKTKGIFNYIINKYSERIDFKHFLHMLSIFYNHFAAEVLIEFANTLHNRKIKRPSTNVKLVTDDRYSHSDIYSGEIEFNKYEDEYFDEENYFSIGHIANEHKTFISAILGTSLKNQDIDMVQKYMLDLELVFNKDFLLYDLHSDSMLLFELETYPEIITERLLILATQSGSVDIYNKYISTNNNIKKTIKSLEPLYYFNYIDEFSNFYNFLSKQDIPKNYIFNNSLKQHLCNYSYNNTNMRQELILKYKSELDIYSRDENGENMLLNFRLSTLNPKDLESDINFLVNTLNFNINDSNNLGDTLVFKNSDNLNLKNYDFLETELGYDLHHTNDNGENILCKLLDMNKIDTSKEFLNEFNYKNENKILEIFKYLIYEKGCSFDSVNTKGQTLLHYAVKANHYQVAKLLLRTGKININRKDISGRTAINEACLNDNISIFNLLLTFNAKLNLRDKEKRNLIAYSKSKLIKETLIQKGIKQEPNNVSPSDNDYIIESSIKDYSISEQPVKQDSIHEEARAEIDNYIRSGMSFDEISSHLSNKRPSTERRLHIAMLSYVFFLRSENISKEGQSCSLNLNKIPETKDVDQEYITKRLLAEKNIIH